MLRTSMALGAALLAAAALAADEGKSGGAGSMKLAGTYSIVAGEREGHAEPPERLRDDVVRFTADTVTVTDKDKRETYSATYKLDTSKKPCVITMTEQSGPTRGERARGLIERDGDTVKLIYALPGGEMPTGFDKTKDKQLLFVLKRQRK